MIGYVTLGTNDLKRAASFYDTLLGEIGAKRIFDMETFIAWSNSQTGCALALTQPYDGKTATVGNGVMAAINVKDKEKINALYRKALELGGTDEGAPGPRGDNFYAAYFRDLDGNKLNFFTFT